MTRQVDSIRKLCVIYGAGAGLGGGLARQFLKTHSLVLLSPSLPGSLPNLRLPSTDDVLALTCHGQAEEFSHVLKEVKKRWPEGVIDVGIVNTGVKSFTLKPFLESDPEIVKGNMDLAFHQTWTFAQTFLPAMLQRSDPDSSTGAKGTLLFTGATMATRGGKNFSALAPSMFARRALAQSLAREMGPQGIHVAIVQVDANIAGPKNPGNEKPQAQPDDIAATYVALVNQPKSAWSQEVDIRPYNETW